LPMLDGRWPESWFEYRTMNLMVEWLKTEYGMTPVKLLVLIFSCTKFGRFPTSGSTSPATIRRRENTKIYKEHNA
jgi:hypothetical protein